MKLKRLAVPGAAAVVWLRMLSDEQKDHVRKAITDRLPDSVGPLVVTERRSTRKRTLVLLGAGAFIGGIVAYFFDPDRGRARRAKARDMSAARVRRGADEARKMRVRAENKASGIRAEMRPRWDEGTGLNDPTLAQKIQSEVLRNFPKGRINVNVENGRVILRGALDRPDQIKQLEAAVSAVPGVREVENLTHLSGSTPRG